MLRFRQFLFQSDAVQRLDMAAALSCAPRRTASQVVFHRADFGQAVERAHHEEGIAQPAVAVVPVAAAVPGASGMLVVMAATIAPVSSYWQSFKVIAARITASCHSSGTARRRVHSPPVRRSCSSNARAVASIPPSRVSSGPSTRLTPSRSENQV
jgi:hypothetical protein